MKMKIYGNNARIADNLTDMSPLSDRGADSIDNNSNVMKIANTLPVLCGLIKSQFNLRLKWETIVAVTAKGINKSKITDSEIANIMEFSLAIHDTKVINPMKGKIIPIVYEKGPISVEFIFLLLKIVNAGGPNKNNAVQSNVIPIVDSE